MSNLIHCHRNTNQNHYKFGKNGEHNKRLATPNVVQATEQTELSCTALSSEECNYSGK